MVPEMNDQQISEWQVYLALLIIAGFACFWIFNKLGWSFRMFVAKKIRVPVENSVDEHGYYLAQIWMPRLIKEVYHLLIVSSTGSGKTTLIRALCRYLGNQSKVYMISPKIQKNLDVAGAGYGGNFQEIEEALKKVEIELKHRLTLFAEGESKFEPLYLILDEWTFIKDKIKGAEDYLKTFSNVGREIGVHLIVSNQSQNVEDLGISGPVRDNFSKIYLMEKAVSALPGVFTDEKRPLVLEFKGKKAAMSDSDCPKIIASTPKNKLLHFDAPKTLRSLLTRVWETCSAFAMADFESPCFESSATLSLLLSIFESFKLSPFPSCSKPLSNSKPDCNSGITLSPAMV